MRSLTLQGNCHLVARIGWQHAAVLGADDGIASIAILIVGLAGAIAEVSGNVRCQCCFAIADRCFTPDGFARADARSAGPDGKRYAAG
jgi:hypothetical protein